MQYESTSLFPLVSHAEHSTQLPSSILQSSSSVSPSVGRVLMYWIAKINAYAMGSVIANRGW